jgi:hypothetical protein
MKETLDEPHSRPATPCGSPATWWQIEVVPAYYTELTSPLRGLRSPRKRLASRTIRLCGTLAS